MRILFLAWIFFFFSNERMTAQEEEFRKIPIAVLPFENIGKNPDMDWLSSGLAEQLTNGLAILPSLKVVERLHIDKVLREQDLQMSDLTGQPAVRAGELLAVKKLLIGSFQIADGRLRVTARIVDAETGVVDEKHLITLEEDLDNIFELYDALIRKITESFGLRLTKTQTTRIERTKKAGTRNIQAYEYYTRGLAAYYGPDKTSWKEARNWFKKALKKDKNYTDARKALANTYIKLDELDDAISEYEKIKKTPDADAETYHTLGLFYLIRKKDDKAREHFEMAIKLNPAYAEAQASLGRWYFNNGDFAAALNYFNTAEQIEPDNPDFLYMIAACRMGLKNTYDALQILERALENGFSDKDKLLKDPIWHPIRSQEKFKDLLEAYLE